MNLEDSPWLQVRFTLPNQTTRRRLVTCISQGKKRKTRNAIQGKQGLPLSTKSEKTTRTTHCQRKNQKGIKQIDKEIPNRSNSVFKGPSKLINMGLLQNSGLIDNSYEPDQEKQLTLPPLLKGPAQTLTISCHGQQYKSIKNSRKGRANRIENVSDQYKTLSIAACYDLCEWKPSSSVCRGPSRSLVSILKPSQEERPKGQTMDGSDTSGYETDHEKSHKTAKRVRFANGTIFRSSKGRRPTKLPDCCTPRELETWQDLQELSFNDFIHRKRLERSIAARSNNKGKTQFAFLKEENSRVKSNDENKRKRHDRHSLLPTIIN